ncbi:biotin carboxylase N-terminal domain-containing protein [Williamsia sp. CHRR-6]|uniref:ATP-binding protein n=1 Tax=Williamsia sp. CHRR-6 TaxID=2835871 RepID=UPI001BDA9D75|nr:biotin carboxylase N-terminal domain-containing protein [Williamsia sp. CHRR-6]MBT0565806.1 acetyl/propionyl-CoA carboxylase subunit alpha [Williamsia sp. CHRR-6]
MTIQNSTPHRRPISSVLVANRGEIARRVFATCARMGIATVAVYSDPDARAPHVAAADRAVRLPGDTSAQTYLSGSAIIAAARAAGAYAIHPGYGFLSENAEFAQAVLDAGLVWIGPTPQAIVSMGSKVNAKAIMADSGVPILGDLDPATLQASDLPVLIKASAGGGGRGMRIVRDIGALSDEVNGAAREAESAFGDATVFCEPYVERGHHIEVQVLADTHGRVWAVGERECSIQRRHQKIIEEAPSPLVERIGGDLRERFFEAARTAAAAIGYVGAGTVEFLADGQGRFYFLEMNTRLQVEHPVTEATTGLDLVEWQLRVAAGEELPPNPPPIVGHSIEARLYAEDPAAGWAPQSGHVHTIDIPADVHFDRLDRPGVRVDSGIEDGSDISVFYDPMLAKVISWAPDRARAAAMLAAALTRARLHGPGTNRDLLVNIMRERVFGGGDTDTGYLDQVGLEVLARPLADADQVRLAAVAAALAAAAAEREAAPVHRDIPAGWRNLFSQYQTRSLVTAGGDEVAVRYRHRRADVELPDDEAIAVVDAQADQVALEVAGVLRRFAVARYVGPDGSVAHHVDSDTASVAFSEVPRFTDPSTVGRPGSLLAPMPGSVIRIGVAVGDQVTQGQPLLWLEAMKMEHTVHAPADGVVAEISVATGQQLAVGDVLAVIASESETEIHPSPAAT